MHPVLFKIGPVTIHTYGTLLATAFIAGIVLMHRYVHFTPELKRDRVIDCALFVLISSLIGARIMYVLLNIGQFHGIVEMVSVQKGGLSFHGGVSGAILGLLLFCRLYKAPFWRLTDIIVPSLALGYAITKIGCFLNGCCIGRPTDLPWATVFPDPAALNLGALTPPSHPVQIYDSMLNVLLSLALLFALKRKRYHGQVTHLWLVLYSVVRIFTESFRKGVSAKLMFASDSATKQPLDTAMFGWPLTQAQVASIAVVVVFLCVMVWNLKKAPKERLPIPERVPDDEAERAVATAREGKGRRRDRKERRHRDARERSRK